MKETIKPKIEVMKASITTLDIDAIVNPANSFGYMGGGVAGVIKKVGGQSIEDEAVHKAPIQVGEALLTNSGDLICRKVIHAPTMHNPAEKTTAHQVFCATKAALEKADQQGFTAVAIPGMGTGVGGLDPGQAAETMLRAINQTEFKHLQKIILIDINDQMVDAFNEQLKKK